MRRQVGARARAPLEEHALGLGQGQDRVQRVIDGVDEAGRALRIAGSRWRRTSRRRSPDPSASSAPSDSGSSRSQPTLNHTGELKATFCVSSMCASSSWKIAASSARGEVAAGHAPVANRLRHAAHQLAHARLALRRADLPMQILRGHDVGRRHRPVDRHLHVLLLEDRVALAVGDQSRAPFPLHFVVGRNALGRETAGKGQASLAVGGLQGGGGRFEGGSRSSEFLSVGENSVNTCPLRRLRQPDRVASL